MADVIAELRNAHSMMQKGLSGIRPLDVELLIDVAEAARAVANNDDFARMANLMSNMTPMQFDSLRAALARLEGR